MAEAFQALLEKRQLEPCRTIRGIKVIEWSKTAYSHLVEEALDQYYTEILLVDGCCIVCKEKTSKFCSNCSTHYCSVRCQKIDWAEHKSTCLGSLSKLGNSINFNDTGFYKSDGKLNGKKYDNVIQQEKKSEKYDEVSDLLDSHSQADSECGSIEDVKENPSKTKYQRTKHVFSNKNFKKGEKYYAKKAVLKENSPESKGEFKTIKGISSEKCERFSVGQIIRIKCTAKSKVWNWGIEENDLEKFQEIQKILSQHCFKFPIIEEPLDKLFGMKYNQKWHRCKIIRKVEESILVRCVDTGAVFRPRILRCRELPPDIRDIKPVAFEFECIDSNSPDVDSDFFNVKVVGIKYNGIYKVMICENIETMKLSEEKEEDAEEKVSGKAEKNVDKEVKEIKNPIKTEKNKRKIFMENNLNNSRRSVVDELRDGSKGIFVLANISDEELFGCIVPEDLEEALYCYKKTSSLVIGEKIDADVGEDVLITLDDCISRRGVIESRLEGQYQVRLIDFGHSVRVNKVYKLSKDVSDLMELACRVTLLDSAYDEFEINRPYMFTVIDRNLKGQLICQFASDQEYNEIVACGILDKTWIVKEEQQKSFQLNYVEFENECIVVIVNVGVDNSIFLKRVDKIWNDKVHNLNLKLNLIENVTDVNIESLKKGDLVLAKYYEDQLWYRAMIISKIKSANEPCEIIFIDYGNKQQSPPSEFKVLPDEFKSEPIFVNRFILFGPNDTFSSEGKLYLQKFKNENREFLMNFVPKTANSVILTDFDGNEINSLAYKNSWVENIPEYISQNFLNVERFDEGIIENFILLYVNENDFMENGYFWAANGKNKNFKFVISELAHMVTEHCESDTEGYVPKVGEFCLAKFQGEWYRGLATFVFSPLAEIFFIDFGNRDIACRETIRKIVPKFLETPSIAVKCVLHDFDKRSEDEIQKLYFSMSNMLNIPLKNKVVVKKVEKNVNYVEFQSINAYKECLGGKNLV